MYSTPPSLSPKKQGPREGGRRKQEGVSPNRVIIFPLYLLTHFSRFILCQISSHFLLLVFDFSLSRYGRYSSPSSLRGSTHYHFSQYSIFLRSSR